MFCELVEIGYWLKSLLTFKVSHSFNLFKRKKIEEKIGIYLAVTGRGIWLALVKKLPPVGLHFGSFGAV